MKYKNITADNTEFVLISFEGPDCYSMVGGLGVRMNNLSRTLARSGFRTHLFFIGDPFLPAEEIQESGNLILHRWGQWLSMYYPGGVYDGEERKLQDFQSSIPVYVSDTIVRPVVQKEKLAVVLGEEWQTAEAMCQLSDTLYFRGLREKTIMFWNANNTFSFHRIDWKRLQLTTRITTISRYMKQLMERKGLNPQIIPNGIPRGLLRQRDDNLSGRLREVLACDLVLCKIARWDPDKRWKEAIEATARLKEGGLRTVLLARGGVEPYGAEMINYARSRGLTINEASDSQNSFDGFLSALTKALPANLIDIKFQVPLDFLAVLYRAADAVLANSGHEPFGIVGLEAMAAGGIVLTGATGEDYAIPFFNSFMVESEDPDEIISYIIYMKKFPEERRKICEAARTTASSFIWEAAVRNLISKLENQARIQGLLESEIVSYAANEGSLELSGQGLITSPPENGDASQELQTMRCLSSTI